MGIARLGSRELANLAYAYLSTSAIQHAITEAERPAFGSSERRFLDDDARDQVIADALEDFNYKLTAELVETKPGVTIERVIRARENTRALAGFRRAMAQANAPES